MRVIEDDARRIQEVYEKKAIAKNNKMLAELSAKRSKADMEAKQYAIANRYHIELAEKLNTTD